MTSHPLRNLITRQQNGIFTPVKLDQIDLAILRPMGPFLLKGNMFELLRFSVEMRTSFFLHFQLSGSDRETVIAMGTYKMLESPTTVSQGPGSQCTTTVIYWHTSSRLHTDRPVDLSLGPKKDICPKGGLRTAARRPTCRDLGLLRWALPYSRLQQYLTRRTMGIVRGIFFANPLNIRAQTTGTNWTGLFTTITPQNGPCKNVSMKIKVNIRCELSIQLDYTDATLKESPPC